MHMKAPRDQFFRNPLSMPDFAYVIVIWYALQAVEDHTWMDLRAVGAS
jgi:hypothetical protein